MSVPPIQFESGKRPSKAPRELVEGLKALDELATQEVEEPEKVIVSEPVEGTRKFFGDEKVRKAVEDRCGPLRFEDLVTTGKLSQKVPIVKDALTVVFQTITGGDEVFCTELAYLESAGGVTHAKIYLLMEMACGIHSINGVGLPPYFDDKGERDRKAFEARWKKVRDLATPILKRIHQNYGWFVERVDQLSVVDDLKNG